MYVLILLCLFHFTAFDLMWKCPGWTQPRKEKKFINIKRHGHYTVWIGPSDRINDSGDRSFVQTIELLIFLLSTLIYRLAIGSFVEEYNNKVQIISLDEDSAEFSAKSTFDHPYPTTKLMWIPDGVSLANIIKVFLFNIIPFSWLYRKVFSPTFWLQVGITWGFGRQGNLTQGSNASWIM